MGLGFRVEGQGSRLLGGIMIGDSVSYSLNSIEGVIHGIISGSIIGVTGGILGV